MINASILGPSDDDDDDGDGDGDDDERQIADIATFLCETFMVLFEKL